MPVARARDPFSPGLLAPLLTILAIAAYRMAPHPWNVAPVGALFVLSGLYLGGGRRAWALPFAAVILSDVILYLRWDGSLFHLERLGDYLAFAMILLMGRSASARGLAFRLGGVLVAPILFFLVSNFAVWLAGEQLYPHSITGFEDCYVAALPFFRGTLAGDWLFGLAGMVAIEGIPLLTRRRPQTA